MPKPAKKTSNKEALRKALAEALEEIERLKKELAKRGAELVPPTDRNRILMDNGGAVPIRKRGMGARNPALLDATANPNPKAGKISLETEERGHNPCSVHSNCAAYGPFCRRGPR